MSIEAPNLRGAFRTTVSAGNEYTMVFRFPSMEAMHEADSEWRTILAALTERKAPGEVEGLVEHLRKREDDTCDEAADALQSQATELATLKQQLAEREEALREAVAALKPFASHVGKSGSVVKLSIGDDTWTHSLTTEHFHRASNVVRRALTRNTDGAATCNQGSAPENGEG
jgi:hypothetical protein